MYPFIFTLPDTSIHYCVPQVVPLEIQMRNQGVRMLTMKLTNVVPLKPGGKTVVLSLTAIIFFLSNWHWCPGMNGPLSYIYVSKQLWKQIWCNWYWVRYWERVKECLGFFQFWSWLPKWSSLKRLKISLGMTDFSALLNSKSKIIDRENWSVLRNCLNQRQHLQFIWAHCNL